MTGSNCGEQLSPRYCLLGCRFRVRRSRCFSPQRRYREIEFAAPLFGANPPCDSDGNMYLAGFKRDEVEKLSREGKVVARFSLSAAEDPDFKKLGLRSHAVDQRGRVFGLIDRKETATYVVEFAPDGKYEKTTKLDVAGLLPYHLAVFPTGEFLVSGAVHDSAPYTAIFDPQGRLIKDLPLPGDVSRQSVGPERKVAGEEKPSDADATLAVLGEVLGGAAAIGPDGNAYLFRNSRPPVMYVISAGGILVRRLSLKPPFDSVVPLGESVSGGRVLVVFGHELGKNASKDEFYSLYDLWTGEHLYDYKRSPELSGGLACYTQNAFLFVGMGLTEVRP